LGVNAVQVKNVVVTREEAKLLVILELAKAHHTLERPLPHLQVLNLIIQH
ncbi:unnamed protein product, partial [Musa acuminata subsp. malaccensis]